jgi:hypothetical protein
MLRIAPILWTDKCSTSFVERNLPVRFDERTGSNARQRRLDPLAVAFRTIKAEPVIASTLPALICRDVATRRTRIVVVVDPLIYGLEDFVD